MITHAELLRKLDYNPETGIFIRKSRRGVHLKNPRVAGCLTASGYVRIGVNNIVMFAHRVAWFYHYGEWPNHYIDHINRNKSDNRISNLRLVDCAMNMHNIGVRKVNTSGYVGVYFMRGAKLKQWSAYAKIRGVNHYIGSFMTAKEAGDARTAFIQRMTPIALSTPTMFSAKMAARVFTADSTPRGGETIEPRAIAQNPSAVSA